MWWDTVRCKSTTQQFGQTTDAVGPVVEVLLMETKPTVVVLTIMVHSKATHTSADSADTSNASQAKHSTVQQIVVTIRQIATIQQIVATTQQIATTKTRWWCCCPLMVQRVVQPVVVAMLVWLLRSLLFGWCGECFGVPGFVMVALPLLLVVMLLPLVVLRFGVALLVERAVLAHGHGNGGLDYRIESVLRLWGGHSHCARTVSLEIRN